MSSGGRRVGARAQRHPGGSDLGGGGGDEPCAPPSGPLGASSDPRGGGTLKLSRPGQQGWRPRSPKKSPW